MEKPRLIVDSRERNSHKIIKEIRRAGFEVTEEFNDVGDYIIDNGITQIYIETKFGADFPSSLMRGKVERDLNDLSEKEFKLFAIIGDQYDYQMLQYQAENYVNNAPQSVTNALTSVAIKPILGGVNIPVKEFRTLTLSDDEEYSAIDQFIDAIKYLMRIIETPNKLYRRKLNSREERIITHDGQRKIRASNDLEAVKIAMICSIPRVGQTPAKNLLKEFDDDLQKIYSAPASAYKNIPRIGQKTIEWLHKLGFQERLSLKQLDMIRGAMYYEKGRHLNDPDPAGYQELEDQINRMIEQLQDT